MTDLPFTEIVARGVRMMLEELILERRKTGDPLVIWKDGRVQKVSAHDVLTPSEIDAQEQRDLPNESAGSPVTLD